MIVAIAGLRSSAVQDALATDFVVLRARQGRKVCMVDTDPRRAAFTWGCERGTAGIWPSEPVRTVATCSLSLEIGSMLDCYSDILISTGERDTHESRIALIAARVVVVTLEVDQVNLDTQYQMVARLNAARMFNPGLRVLFVIIGPAGVPSQKDAATICAFVTRVMSATLAHTVIRRARDCMNGQGRCVFDGETCDPESAADMHALYNEIFSQ